MHMLVSYNIETHRERKRENYRLVRIKLLEYEDNLDELHSLEIIMSRGRHQRGEGMRQ